MAAMKNFGVEFHGRFRPCDFGSSSLVLRPNLPHYFECLDRVARQLNIWNSSQFWRQNLCLKPSTVVDNTLLVSTNICNGGQNLTAAQRRSYHGGVFDLRTTGASFNNVSFTSANLPTDLGWNDFNPTYSMAGQTQVDLVANVEVPNMTVLVITKGMNFTAGRLGLGRQSSLLHGLKDANIIPSLGFGLNAGSQSFRNPRDGSFVLSGFDSASLTGPFHEYPMNYSDTLAQRHCPLQVQIKGLQLRLKGQNYNNVFRISAELTVPGIMTKLTSYTNRASRGFNASRYENVYPHEYDADLIHRYQVYLTVDYEAPAIKLAEVKQNAVTPSPVRRHKKQEDRIEKAEQHGSSPSVPSTTVAEGSPDEDAPLSPELSVERRTFELWSPNVGYPDASSRAPYAIPQRTNSEPYTAARPSVSSNTGSSTYATNP
ncbi:hypothetical protein EK21DRAFT_85860 [Setomelanomma holmii]|uniref:Uncharacterized protein n=1 Tax=Setomelanomma holmii TaxID=210430 RepID=A0A9P4LR85_9PLEO|nr:hypothetical protein EK21DRAFT_85860 [Setomelanomma holmii]